MSKIIKLSAIKPESIFNGNCDLSAVERDRIFASYRSFGTFLDVDDVTPYDKNPRLNEDAVAGVADSIRNYGFEQPLVLDRDNVIIVGHTRRLACKSLGIAVIPVIIADHLSPEQVKAYRIDDNKTGELSMWDFSLLQEELLNLEESGYDMSSLAFSEDEMDRLLRHIAEDSEDTGSDDEGEIPESEDEEKECDSVPNGVYQLGDHRLVCGDDVQDADAIRRHWAERTYGKGCDWKLHTLKIK